MRCRRESLFKLFVCLVLVAAAMVMFISHISSSSAYNIVGEPYVLTAAHSIVDKIGSMEGGPSNASKTARSKSENKHQLVDLNIPTVAKRRHGTGQKHSILWINKPSWMPTSMLRMDTYHRMCAYRNCLMTTNTTQLADHSAIIFEALGDEPPMPTQKPHNQIWIFFSIEPASIDRSNRYYQHPKWRSLFNWSMTYMADSNIFVPYGSLTSREAPPTRDYSAIFHQKSRFAAWIVSHCGAESGRDNYVQELRQHGIPVDVLGRCGSQRVQNDRRNDLIELGYKFYFAFENSFCTDYITEKFFGYYNLDIVLVARGGADYDQLLPNGTFINTAHFKSAKNLAVFLKKVNSSESMYVEYLRNKDKYVASDIEGMHLQHGFCNLCAKLNNKADNYHVHEDISEFYNKGTCFRPPDVIIRRKLSMLVDLVVLMAAVKLAYMLFKVYNP